MKYVVYKVTNNLNGKFYIGKHKTTNLDDNYMGSGKLIKQAIKKYGIDNFTKEILYEFDNEEDMNSKEAELVVVSENTYNLCPGGQGGFGYINTNNLCNTKLGRINADKVLLEKYGITNPSQLEKNRVSARLRLMKLHQEKKISAPNWSGKKHKEETKKKIGLANSGIKGPNGTCWVTNGTQNKKIKLEELNFYIQHGYRKGRTIKINEST